MKRESSSLTSKHCRSCEGMGEPMSRPQAQEQLKSLTQWQLGDDAKGISRSIKTKNFMTAIALINRIAPIAEGENHHPDIHLTNYRHLRVELSTHAIGGLSENDFIIAAKIEQIFEEP
jgi:4a-hydroxytetrahydrobiopterin dehydratase